MKEILGYTYFTGRTSVCIVIVDVPFSGPKAYIGAIDGFDEQVDLNNTADWGNTFPLDIAITLTKQFGTINNSKSNIWETQQT